MPNQQWIEKDRERKRMYLMRQLGFDRVVELEKEAAGKTVPKNIEAPEHIEIDISTVAGLDTWRENLTRNGPDLRLAADMKRKYGGIDFDPNDGELFGQGSPLHRHSAVGFQSGRIVVAKIVTDLRDQFLRSPSTDIENIPKLISADVKGKSRQSILLDASSKLFGWLRPESKTRQNIASTAENIKTPSVWDDSRVVEVCSMVRVNIAQQSAIQRLAGYLVLHPEQYSHQFKLPIEAKLLIEQTGLKIPDAIKIAQIYIEVLQEKIDQRLIKFP